MTYTQRTGKKTTARSRKRPALRSPGSGFVPPVTTEVVQRPVSVQDLLSMIRVAAGRAEPPSLPVAAEDAPVVLSRPPPGERKLTVRQSKVVALLLRGRTIRQIAGTLRTNIRTIERQLRIIIGKLAPTLARPGPGAGRTQ